jgi:hypothetical protein
VIVRIFNEGQYRLDESHHHELDGREGAVVKRVDAGDEGGFRAAYDALLAFVREHGAALSDDELEASDFILPPADLSFAEAGEEFSGEGLIPDPPAARA